MKVWFEFRNYTLRDAFQNRLLHNLLRHLECPVMIRLLAKLLLGAWRFWPRPGHNCCGLQSWSAGCVSPASWNSGATDWVLSFLPGKLQLSHLRWSELGSEVHKQGFPFATSKSQTCWILCMSWLPKSRQEVSFGACHSPQLMSF